MALSVPKLGNSLSGMLKDGYQHMSGLEEAVYRNIAATTELANIVRTSLGPNGRNKMVINHLEKLFLTNDAATIMKELDVIHPAAKLITMAAQQQEAELGDATNFVLVFAGALLERGEYLLRMGLHPSEVIEGYQAAAKITSELLQELVVDSITDATSATEFLKLVKPTVASKQYGLEDLLAPIIVEACLEVMPKNPLFFNVDSVRIVKILGGSLQDTSVVKGMVFGREAEGTVKAVQDSKIAIFTCALENITTETKGTVLIQNAKELLDFSKGDEKQLEETIKGISDSGVKVVVGGSGIGDLALHFFNRYGIMVVKILSKFDLRRLCRVTGATALTKLQTPLPEEMGYVNFAESMEIGSDRCTVFRQLDESTRTATIVIRGSTMNLMDDIERAIDDGVNAVKASTKDPRLVAGAGACEIEVARKLIALAGKTPGLSQYAIKAFGQAFEVIPRAIAQNTGMDSTIVLSKLYAEHEAGKTSVGVDIESEQNGVLDAKEAKIFDSVAVKSSAIKLAVHSAITVLSIDQIIMSKMAGGPKPRSQEYMD